MPVADPSFEPMRPPAEHHHRDVRGGAARAAVFGVSDGLVSNVALILGVAAADPAASVVRLVGLAGLVSGAVSMAAGEYVSMQAQRELLERELELERRELARRPHVEQVELEHIYQSRGVDPDTARSMAAELMRDPDIALQTHAREELGIDPEELGSPVRAATSSFVSFALGALVPLLPWFVTRGTAAKVASVAAGILAALAVGVALANLTGRSRAYSGARQAGIAAAAAAVTFVIGNLVGVTTG
jgi:vacuolar iron transporter family protein